MTQASQQLLKKREGVVLITSIAQAPDVNGGGFNGFNGATTGASSSETVIAAGGTLVTVVYITETASTATSDLDPMNTGALSTITTLDSPIPSNSAADLPFSRTQGAAMTRGRSANDLPTRSSLIPSQTSSLPFTPTSHPAPSQGYEETSHVNLGPIIGTVVPLISIFLFLGLFCCWFRKKKVRDRQLDDLERTAEWVTGTSPADSTSKAKSDSQHRQKPAVQAQQADICNDGNDGEMQVKTMSSVDDGWGMVTKMANPCYVEANEDTAELGNPFATPALEDDEAVGASQIGLAITTSIHSHASSAESAATVIRHDAWGLSNPFASDLDSLDSLEVCTSPTSKKITPTTPKNLDVQDSADDCEHSQSLVRTDHNNISATVRSSSETVVYSPTGKIEKQ